MRSDEYIHAVQTVLSVNLLGACRLCVAAARIGMHMHESMIPNWIRKNGCILIHVSKGDGWHAWWL